MSQKAPASISDRSVLTTPESIEANESLTATVQAPQAASVTGEVSLALVPAMKSCKKRTVARTATIIIFLFQLSTCVEMLTEPRHPISACLLKRKARVAKMRSPKPHNNDTPRHLEPRKGKPGISRESCYPIRPQNPAPGLILQPGSATKVSAGGATAHSFSTMPLPIIGAYLYQRVLPELPP